MVFFSSQKLESFKDRFFEENQEIPFFEKLIKNFVIFYRKMEKITLNFIICLQMFYKCFLNS